MFASTSAALIVLATLSTSVHAHSYMIKPLSRLTESLNAGTSTADGSGKGGALCHIGDGTKTCCQQSVMKNQQTFQRGDVVPTAWWRNNHVGGFNRYSIIPQSASPSQDAFDAADAQMNFECAQVGCTATYGGSSPNSWNGGDSKGSLGWSNACSGAFKIPYHLADGSYTVQGVWFGQGNGQSANSPFQACVDLKISGGPTGEQPKCPLWQGGDTSEKSSTACVYVSVNNPTYQGTCKSANACSGAYTTGVPKGLGDCVAGNAPSSYPLMMASSSGVPNTFGSSAATGSASTNATVSNVGLSSSSGNSTTTDISSGTSGSSSGTTGSSGSSSGKKCSTAARQRRRARRMAERRALSEHLGSL